MVELVAGVIGLVVFVAAVVVVALWLMQAAGWFEADEEVFEPVYPGNIVPLRGRDLTTVSRVRATRRGASVGVGLPDNFRGIFWGGEYWPLELANLHFFLQGATGSGKSVSLAQTVDSLLPLLGLGLGNRMVIFDPKREWPGRLYTRLGAEVPVHLLNPFEVRGSCWDLAKDIRTRAEALMLAAMLVPEEKADQNKFFRDAARAVLFALIVVLMHYAPGRWNLRHLIVISRLRSRLAAVLKILPETADVAGQFLHQNKSGREIVATIGSCLSSYSVVAACWDRARSSVGFSEFLDSEGVLVLGYDESVSAAMSGIYRLMVKLMADRVMLNDDPTDRTYFVFDEFKLFGRSDDLVNVAIRGRSSGACLFVAAQDVNALDALYGRETAKELLGNLLSKMFLRVESEAAATFAAECVGSHEVLQYTWSQTYAQHSSSTVSESVVKRQLVLPDEFRNLPMADGTTDAVHAYALTSITDPFRARFPFVGAMRALAPPLGFEPYLRRPAPHQRLRPFGPGDLVELNLPATPALLKTIHPKLFRPDPVA